MRIKRVVITGLGALTPIGNDVSTYWDSLLKGVSGANPITRFNTDLYKTKFACEVKDFDPQKFIDRKEVRKMDLVSQYAMVSAMEAVQDSGLALEQMDTKRIGIIYGTGIGGFTSLSESFETFYQSGKSPRLSPFFIPRILGDMIVGNIALFYDLKGPSYITTSACASSANAIIDAFHLIQLGKADVMFCGGSEAVILETPIAGFNAMNALSTRNETYLTASSPFDKDRDGFVMGEGAATLIIEEYEHAIARGAKIYAEIGGIGMTTDTHHITSPHPDGEAAYNAMKLAVEDAHLPIESVDHINTHGTATPAGDISECLAIEKLFGAHTPNVIVNSTKSMTGHLLGAAGAVEAVATILSLFYGKIPPTINIQNLDPEIPNLNFAKNILVAKNIHVALSNSFGFGGHNCSILFKKI
ncbi:MAG TPA: beta-ketoacyl-ACP synthase II [Bacteroidales bacterium]|nr:beta-ketoacyl-ACP synthase II [Bacteroidales bacterium]